MKIMNSSLRIVKTSSDDEAEDRYAMKTATLKILKSSIEFKQGEEFQEKTVYDIRVTSSISFDDNKMIHIQKFDKDDKTVTIERRFFNDELISIYSIGDVTCTIWYEHIDDSSYQ